LTDIAAGDSDLSGAYDADMKRVSRDEDDAATGFVFDGEKLLRSVPASGATTHFVSEGASVYSPLIGSMQVNGGATGVWHLFDALGTTIGLSDADGALTDTRLYDAFGNLLGSTGSATTPFGYVGAYGYYNEPGVDLMLLWHRWCDEGNGFFFSRDALGRGIGPQQHTYCSQCPTRYVDPQGDAVQIIGIVVIVIVAGVLIYVYLFPPGRKPEPDRGPADFLKKHWDQMGCLDQCKPYLDLLRSQVRYPPEELPARSEAAVQDCCSALKDKLGPGLGVVDAKPGFERMCITRLGEALEHDYGASRMSAIQPSSLRSRSAWHTLRRTAFTS